MQDPLRGAVTAPGVRRSQVGHNPGTGSSLDPDMRSLGEGRFRHYTRMSDLAGQEAILRSRSEWQLPALPHLKT
jgi:hypothetical protein